MEILVLGATGNTGSEVVKQLKEAGADFGIMARSADAANKLDLNPNQVRVSNYDDVEAMTQALEGVKKIYVAMPAHPSNQQWIENTVAAAKAAGVELIVKLSGMGARADAGSEIIRTHVLTDNIVKASGIAYTIVQPNSFFQNLFGSLPTINALGQFFLPLAQAKQSVIDIRDVASVIVTALTQSGHENQTYLISGPEALTFAEQAAILTEVSGKQIDYIAVPQEAAESAMKGAGMDNWTAEKLAEIMAWFGEGHYASVTDTVERVTGNKPRTFRAFAEEFSAVIEK
ncbi:SDR family oxidoreductase [Vibrio sp. SCSIO 43140]|uniref:SDR family oxidoreductase n=1 Tax=Vibrio sp. SCSIO 43140 TaxID=2819100 RepID=UPI002075E63E|nr:SDR family oxidoreductase [Vibrio sp. SCSIO 43140]USD63117.1 SDR family oxidoreductase [Vibrio sp. SCSIO 43140]